MFGFLRRFLGFNNEEPTTQTRVPVACEKWVLKSRADGPWPREDGYGVVEIIEVKQDWVRYAIGSVFPDCRHRIEVFKDLYRALV